MSDMDFTGVMDGLASGETSAESPSATHEPTSAEASASTAESSALATTPATVQEATTDTDPTVGQMIPYARFREVNEERSSFKGKLDKLAWAEQLPEHAGPVMTEFYRNFASDPIGTLIREVESIAQADPNHAQAVRSAAARWLGAARGQQAAQDVAPEPDLQAQDGTLVYSAPQAQKLLEWRERQFQQRIAQQIQPLQQRAAEAEAQRIRAEIQSNADQWAQQTYAQWKQRPFFEDNKREIAALMQQHGYGIADAYADVLTQKVLPKISATERSSVVAALQQKAVAGTTNPARGPAQGQARPKDFAEAMRNLTSAAG